MIELKVPDIGGSAVPIIELHVKEGDTIAIDEPLITLESDKASMDVPSTHNGIIKSLLIKIGDKVEQDQVIAIIEAKDVVTTSNNQEKVKLAEVAENKLNPVAEQKAQELATDIIKNAQQVNTTSSIDVNTQATTNKEISFKNNDGKISHASPSVRKFARELGISELFKINGSGLKNRITHDDIKSFVKNALQNSSSNSVSNNANVGNGGNLNLLDWPKVDFSKFGEIETKPLSRIQKISGANLHRNWVMIPHVTNNDEADITDLEAFRVELNKEYAKQNVKVTMLAFLIKASVSALKKFPIFNSSLDGENIVLKQYFNIGFAADTPNGLVVPVIKNADKKGIIEIAKEMSELAALAREGKLKPDQMQGGCFSISSLGGIGGTTFTPIINAPEVAILGVCKSFQKPVWDEAKEQFIPRLTLPLSLSWDHRVIDGAVAARFNAYLAQILADFRRILL
ncbi:MAG: hypothetical protein RLZZ210_283 [Pseudomonadota bacterium]|jgi:pyruvate dehydrogenase E2 component (dihydrolipoamide acetyltransferase)